MLKTGTFVVAIGKLEKTSDNNYILSSLPTGDEYEGIYLFKDVTPVDVLNGFKNVRIFLKGVTIIVGIAGLLTAGYCLYRIYKKKQRSK
jgi:hypothetical protein